MLMGIELAWIMDNVEALESELRISISQQETSDLEERVMMKELAYAT
jgi:hypothetical protein